MEFYEDGDYLISQWEPKDYLQGYGNVLHGGVQATLMDELASWVVHVKAQTGGVTADMWVKYRRPVYVNKGSLTIRGKLKEKGRKLAVIEVELLNASGERCAEGELRYFLYPEKVAREKFYYPGPDAFYE
jgi:uncharacterized protein (TIGR00369 family)